jgi:hypothetical protein
MTYSVNKRFLFLAIFSFCCSIFIFGAVNVSVEANENSLTVRQICDFFAKEVKDGLQDRYKRPWENSSAVAYDLQVFKGMGCSMNLVKDITINPDDSNDFGIRKKRR